MAQNSEPCRALDLLEEYHAQLYTSGDEELKWNIERVIRAFKSSLFLELLNIHNFYEETLLNQHKSPIQKVLEARSLAEKWESNPPLQSATISALRSRSMSTSHLNGYGTGCLSPSIAAPPPPPPHTFVQIPVTREYNTLDHLERIPGVQKIDIYKGNQGLGFQIVGGNEVAGDPGIYVTKIIDGRAVSHDGRLQVGDKIVAVDNISLENVSHAEATAVLKTTGTKVTLMYLHNPRPEYTRFLQEHSAQSAPSVRSGSMQNIDRSFISHKHIDAHYPSSAQHSPAVAAIHQPTISSLPRKVTMYKGNQGLGLNIIGGEDGEPVYVSSINPGGPAEQSGNVFRGDALLAVDDIILQNASHQQAAECLRDSLNPVTLTLQYRPHELEAFQRRIENIQNQPLYVRTLFEFQPNKEPGAPPRSMFFKSGEILQITNMDDENWWNARKVFETTLGPEEVIPSQRRVERRARRKQVNFSHRTQSLSRNADGRGSKSLHLSSKFPFLKSTESLSTAHLQETAPTPEIPIPTYERVELHR